MDLGITGRNALITGGSAGLGLACARELVGAGVNVAIASRSEVRVAAATEELRALAASVPGKGRPPNVIGSCLDVADFESARVWVEKMRALLGSVDIIIANAGGPPTGVATDFDLEAYRASIETNLLASINLADASVGGMRKAGWGRVLFIASICAKQPLPNLALSNTSRAGLLGYAKSLAGLVAAEGVTVNVLAPGFTRTERLLQAVGEQNISALAAGQIPAGRVGEPEEFGAAAAFLASDRASYITGVVLPVDGGAVMSLF